MGSGLHDALVSVDLGDVPDAALHLTADVSNPGERDRVIDQLLAWPSRIGALVYSIGIAEPARATRAEWPRWQRIIEIDFMAAAHVLCALHDRVLQDATAVVVVDSTAADTGSSVAPPYGAAKAACRILTRSLATLTGSTGARYNSVAPGPTETPLGTGLARSLGTDQQLFAQRTIAKRLGQPEEVAAAVAFLCGPGASFINGTVVVADGGYLAG
ncbi:MAG: meso-butanediol dehydrogenase / (S,S)-butanediol dehydrogenase / diacetyl reductase [Chloroflexota bacterium]|jgi:Tropinone reductase 1|nr:meso-butanediol dehydrogenase / (S,S)-butanediol dehydrogenase / diacetyl reductase [Chloroflexota bacterium]